jgi:hypothetical protein
MAFNPFDLELEITNARNNAKNYKDSMNYSKNNENKTEVLINLGKLKAKEPIAKLQAYEAIKVETEKLFIREKTLFIINSVVTVGLMVATIRIIL